MNRFLYIIVLFLIGCGSAFESLVGSQYIDNWGEYPPPPDNTDISKFEPLNENQQLVEGETVSDSEIAIGGENNSSVATAKGTQLYLVARVTTEAGNNYYIAQQKEVKLASQSMEGYISSDSVKIIDSESKSVSKGNLEVRKNLEVVEEEPSAAPSPAPPANMGSTCPSDVIIARFGETRGRHGETMGAKGAEAEVEYIVGFDWRDNPESLRLKVTHDKGWTGLTINVKAPYLQKKGEDLEISATVDIDPEATESTINFAEFVPENSRWAQTRIRFDFEGHFAGQTIMMAKNLEVQEPVTPDEAPGAGAGSGAGEECGMDVLLSSPIVLHMDPTKEFKTLSAMESGVEYDLSGDNHKVQTGWISSDSALLGLDLNGNGILDNGSELFGEWTLMPNGEYAKNGYEALSQYLSNHSSCSSVIDSSNPVFKHLLVWRDLNQDGFSQPYELSSLSQSGITSVDTNYEELPREKQGSLFSNVVKYKSTFHGEQCPSSGCASYDVFFTTINNSFVGQK